MACSSIRRRRRLPTPKVHEPLFECGAAVRVSNLHVDARVYVFSRMLGAPIGERTADAAEVDVPVAPLLIRDDKIFAEQRGCGLVSSQSDAVIVGVDRAGAAAAHPRAALFLRPAPSTS